MQDRYLFRGKRTDNGEWEKGYYCFVGFTNNQKHYIIPGYASAFYGIEVDPATVGQCTGRKDKNGKLIFEGDILFQKTTPKFKQVNSSEWERKYCVRYGYCDFRKGHSGHSTFGFYLSDLDAYNLRGGIGGIESDNYLGYYPYEIIGNIHNKED